jgi:hypothetical protein
MKQAKIPPERWKWFGNAGHFICSRDCQFHLCTLVGKYLVSTVGQMRLDRVDREIHAKVHDPRWLAKFGHLKGDEFDAAYTRKFGFETVGYDWTYETMVFKAGKPCSDKECNYGLPNIEGSELDFSPYNDAGAATRGHLAMCRKWAKAVRP